MLGLMSLSLMSLLIPKSKWSWYQKIWSLCFVGLISIIHLFSPFWGYDFINHMMSCDLMSAVLICLTFWIFLMMMLASQNSVKINLNNSHFFMNTLLVLNLTLIATFLCSSSLSFYFLFESSLLPTLLLILGWGYQPERLQSGMYMMIYTVGGSLPLLLVVLWFCKSACSSDMLMMSILRKQPILLENTWAMNYLTLAIFMAFLIKLPMFTVHLWLPKAHVEAPVSGSMVLAAILLKLGGYGILRFYQYFNFYMSGFSVIIFSLALWGGLLSSVICFRQVDFKALIAYSSVGHMSLMLAGAFSNTSWGWSGALILMISHGFCSSALFALANYTYEKIHSRSLFLNKGMLLLVPSIAMWWFMFCAMNMAAPPSINLLGEIMIFPCVMFSSFLFLIPLGLMSFFSALYSMYLYTCIHHGGSPKFSKPFSHMNMLLFSVMVLHWIPGNILIVKSDIMLW